jgi:hypothetical protein
MRSAPPQLVSQNNKKEIKRFWNMTHESYESAVMNFESKMKLSLEDIEKIESEIGLKLPIDVHEKYLESNGYLGPCNTQLLFTYNGDPEIDIVKFNAFMQAEDWLPENLRQLVIVGIDGVGGNIGYDHRTNKAVLWYPVEGEHFDMVENSVSDIWASVIESYNNS